MEFDGTLCKLLAYLRGKNYCEMLFLFQNTVKRLVKWCVVLLSPKSLPLPDRHPGDDGFVQGQEALLPVAGVKCYVWNVGGLDVVLLSTRK